MKAKIAVLVFACLGSVFTLPESAARAQGPVAESEWDHFHKGQRFFDLGKWDEAVEEFEKAYTLRSEPSFLYNMAETLRRKGDTKRALDVYTNFLTKAPKSSMRPEVEGWIRKLQRQLDEAASAPKAPEPTTARENATASPVPSVVFPRPPQPEFVGPVVVQPVKPPEVTPPQPAMVQLPASPSPGPVAPVNPVPPPTPEARRDGVLTIPVPTIGEVASDKPSDHAQRTWGWVVLGVGAAGLVTGAATGIAVMANTSLRNDCPNGGCPSSKSASVDTYNSLRVISTVGFIVGGVGAAVGATLLLWTPTRESEPRMALWVGPGSAGVRGAF